jgi:hypothetical protein
MCACIRGTGFINYSSMNIINQVITEIGLKAVRDDRCEFRLIRNLAGNKVSFFSFVVHDDRNGNWYVRNPAGNGVSFLLFTKYLTTKRTLHGFAPRFRFSNNQNYFYITKAILVNILLQYFADIPWPNNHSFFITKLNPFSYEF